MNTLRTLSAAAALLTLAGLTAASANARCGGVPQAANNGAGLFSLTPKTPLLASLPRSASNPGAAPHAASAPSIVGFWYTQFRTGGDLVDDGFDIWQSDGLEILNDSPAPATGAVCLGVYTQTAPNAYTLNHPSWVFDETNTNLIGVVVIRSNVTVSADGNSFSGKGSTDVYDFDGNSLFHSDFDVTGVRITPNDLPQFGGIPRLPVGIVKR